MDCQFLFFWHGYQFFQRHLIVNGCCSSNPISDSNPFNLYNWPSLKGSRKQSITLFIFSCELLIFYSLPPNFKPPLKIVPKLSSMRLKYRCLPSVPPSLPPSPTPYIEFRYTIPGYIFSPEWESAAMGCVSPF